MAQRRSFRNNVADLASTLLENNLASGRQAQQAKLQADLSRETFKQNQAPELMKYMLEHPENADAIGQLGQSMGLNNLGPGIPSNSDLVANMRQKVAKDPRMTSDSDIATMAKGANRGLEVPSYGQMDTSDGSDGLLPSKAMGPVNSPTIQELMAKRKEAIMGQDAEVKRQLGIKEDTSRVEAHGKTIGEGSAKHENAPVALQDDLAALTAKGPIEAANKGLDAGAVFDAEHTPGRSSQRVSEAGKMSGAQAGAAASASAPYKTPEFLTDDQGNTHAMRFGPKGASEVDLPPGMSKGGNAKLSGPQLDAQIGLNTAEVEGVKVLAGLKKSGLDQSNDPFDPRWQKFMVGIMKVSPQDWDKATTQNRVAYINAVLTRGLMGGRPSQYVAQIIQQHLPDGQMSGMQLSHVLQQVLTYGDERRTELEALTKRAPGSLRPTSGMTWAQWQQMQQDGQTGPTAPDPAASGKSKLDQLRAR